MLSKTPVSTLKSFNVAPKKSRLDSNSGLAELTSYTLLCQTIFIPRLRFKLIGNSKKKIKIY